MLLINLMNLEAFKYLPLEEQIKHIRDHRHFLGERNQHYINYGEAVLDFFKEYLRAKDAITVSEDLIKQLQDENYKHCCNCGFLFKRNFDEENKIGFLSKTLGIIVSTFNISSSICNSCFERREK